MCPECNRTYHNNYYIDGPTESTRERIYYEGIPAYIQVGDHQFVETGQVDRWIGMMLLGWVSASNCAAMYNAQHRDATHHTPAGWEFGETLTTNHVWDGFIIKSLLEDCQQHKRELVVPHSGHQNTRFTMAMSARNEAMILYGQPNILHYCDKCIRFYEDEKKNQSRVWPLVTDGISMGHPCCSFFRCTIPLTSNQDRFCPTHCHLVNVCSIVGCSRNTVCGRKACDLKEHQDMETAHYA